MDSHNPRRLVTPSQTALDVKHLRQCCIGEEDRVHDDKVDSLLANLNIVDAEYFDNQRMGIFNEVGKIIP